MYTVKPLRAAWSAGFTLLELFVALCVISTLLAIGTPLLSDWVAANRAANAVEFYADGFRQARQQALRYNSASRLILSENAGNQQMDWQIDVCFPTPALPCNQNSGVWSTALAPASNDPAGAAGFKSMVRSASGLPGTGVLTLAFAPDGADQIYFTPLGWVDQTVNPRLSRLTLTPVKTGSFPSAALVVTLAGLTTKCDPTVTAGDSRLCPP